MKPFVNSRGTLPKRENALGGRTNCCLKAKNAPCGATKVFLRAENALGVCSKVLLNVEDILGTTRKYFCEPKTRWERSQSIKMPLGKRCSAMRCLPNLTRSFEGRKYLWEIGETLWGSISYTREARKCPGKASVSICSSVTFFPC